MQTHLLLIINFEEIPASRDLTRPYLPLELLTTFPGLVLALIKILLMPSLLQITNSAIYMPKS